ncbi:MAG: hypothetical protein BWZ02_02582 [Lentisphaerae bacterium ADurb.BinA184]|nr:MAG: hypothetical protein BWZ02_02582 [Lentisphaerae bacterium ADurb.BinA184]
MKPQSHIGRAAPPAVRACRLSLLALVLGAATAAVAGGWADWRHPEAAWRLRAARVEASGKAHLLRVDFPAEIQGQVKGLVAYRGDHQPLPAAPVLVGTVTVAAEVQVPAGPAFDPAFAATAGGQFPDPQPVLVYLLAEASVPNPLGEANRPPVAVYWTPERYIARPHTADELRALDGRLGAAPFREDVPGFVLSGGARPPSLEVLRQSAVRLRCSTTLVLGETRRLRLGADAPSTAWFLYADGRLVADWKNHALAEGGAFLSEVLVLPAGLHSLDLVAVKRPLEPVPALSWKAEGGQVEVIPTGRLCASRPSLAWRLEAREGGAQPGLAVSLPTALGVAAGGRDPLALRIANLSLDAANAPIASGVVAEIGGIKPAFGDLVVLDGTVPPAVRLTVADAPAGGALTWPVSFPRPTPLLMPPQIWITRLPVTVAEGAAADLTVCVSGFPDSLQAVAQGTPFQIRAVQRDRAGQALGEPHAVDATLAQLRAGHPVSVLLAADAARLDLSVTLAGTPLVGDARIHLLDPAGPVERIRPAGERLTLDGEPALLRCPRPQGGEFHVRRSWRPKCGRTLVWVDEFWAPANGPGAQLRPDEWLTAHTAFKATHLRVAEAASRDCRPDLRLFDRLADTFGRQPCVVVWMTGAADLRNKVPLDEYERRLLFLAEATRRRGALPILVTVPPFADLPPERSREAALRVKQLALRLGVPALDPYSVLRAEEAAGRDSRRFLSTAPGVTLGAANDDGRAWMCRLLRDQLRDVRAAGRPPRPADPAGAARPAEAAAGPLAVRIPHPDQARR